MADPKRFLDPDVLTDPYEGEMWTKYVSGGGLALAFIGLICPWISTSFGSFIGVKYWLGAMAFVLVIEGGAVCFVQRNWSAAAMAVIGTLTTLAALIGLFSIDSNVGVGVYLTLLGGLATAAGGFAVIFELGPKPGGPTSYDPPPE